MVYDKAKLLVLFTFAVPWLTASTHAADSATKGPLNERVNGRDFPSVFQAWNPVDMVTEYPQDTIEQRIRAAAKHDVYWEEPISQLSYGVELALGGIWDHPYPGLATGFTRESVAKALENRSQMLELNPHAVFLMEVRWRDAPGSFLPEDSPFWKRNSDGTRAAGWDGGPEPYYLLDPANQAFQENIARQCKSAIDSGVYDGIMLDWSGHLEIVKITRQTIGDDGLIIVNIHDDMKDGQKYGQLINGSFMECNPQGPGEGPSSFKTTWKNLREGLQFFEANLREPRVNCLETWGRRDDLRRMRAVTTLGLTCSNASVLYADPNPLKTPDHLHDWYDFWDVPLGRPQDKGGQLGNGAWQRTFDGGVVVYNELGNGPVTVTFDRPHRRVSDGTSAREFSVDDADGDIFVP